MDRFVKVCDSGCCITINEGGIIIDLEKGLVNITSGCAHPDYIVIVNGEVREVELKAIRDIRQQFPIDLLINKVTFQNCISVTGQGKILDCIKKYTSSQQQTQGFYVVVPSQTFANFIKVIKNSGLIRAVKNVGKRFYVCKCCYDFSGCEQIL